MMTLLHCIEHLPNLRFHHKRIQISTPLIVSHGYSSFLGLNIKQLKPQQFSSSGFPPSLSSELLICIAVMLKCSVRHYERQISCFSCRRPRDERLFDLCPSWWWRRSGASGTPYSCGRVVWDGGSRVGELHGVALYIQMLQGKWMHFPAADVKQMLGFWDGRFVRQAHDIAENMYGQQTFQFQIGIWDFDGSTRKLSWVSIIRMFLVSFQIWMSKMIIHLFLWHQITNSQKE